MQTKSGKRILSCLREKAFCLCMVLIVAMALITTGCGGKTDGEGASSSGTETTVQTEGEGDSSDGTEQADNGGDPSDGTESNTQTDVSVLGEGSLQFALTVVDKDGNETQFEIHTDKEIVGEALVELGLIAGEESEYGLFVKTVNGITADYDQDGVYWAFYINGEYAMSGVDSTAVTEGDSYSFKVE